MQDKIGLFEEAELGTIFLDEVNSMAQPLQTKLLRVLQERQIRRVGDTKSIPINVRVLAATNEVLGEKIKGGNFPRGSLLPAGGDPDRDARAPRAARGHPAARESFPPEERRADRHRAEEDRPESRWRCCRAYRWPGNVRELENAIERACALCDDGLIRTTDLPPQVSPPGQYAATGETTGALPVGQTLDEYIREQERRYIEETIKFNAGSREKAAKMLGISMATLYRKLEVKRARPRNRRPVPGAFTLRPAEIRICAACLSGFRRA